MKGRLLSLIVVGLAAVATARADLAASGERAAATLPDYGFGDLPWSQGVLPAAPPVQDAPSLVPQVRTLPPAPDSAALCLSALAGFGVWQLGRSARKLHFGALPSWYHADVVQVGHSTPLDLEFSLAAMPACAFDAPAPQPAFAYRIPRELRSRLRSQFFLLVESPRGPPLP
jgi:hypothetical protein